MSHSGRTASTCERTAKPTLTPVELNHGDTLQFMRRNGARWEMTLLNTSAAVTARGLWPYRDEAHDHGDIRAYAFDCVLRINGREYQIRREVATPASFDEPVTFDGVLDGPVQRRRSAQRTRYQHAGRHSDDRANLVR